MPPATPLTAAELEAAERMNVLQLASNQRQKVQQARRPHPEAAGSLEAREALKQRRRAWRARLLQDPEAGELLRARERDSNKRRQDLTLQDPAGAQRRAVLNERRRTLRALAKQCPEVVSRLAARRRVENRRYQAKRAARQLGPSTQQTAPPGIQPHPALHPSRSGGPDAEHAGPSTCAHHWPLPLISLPNPWQHFGDVPGIN
jgi:hypothetical protein